MKLDRRIYAPTTRRLVVAIGYAESRGDEPRLWLAGYEGSDFLYVAVPGKVFRDNTRTWPWTGGRTCRLGTLDRYRRDVEWVKDVARELGWAMTDDERALITALEDYGRASVAA
jgi:hypothetical protein